MKEYIKSIPTEFYNHDGQRLNIAVSDFKIVSKLNDVVKAELTVFVSQAELSNGRNIVVLIGSSER